jgi:hypothetical protein
MAPEAPEATLSDVKPTGELNFQDLQHLSDVHMVLSNNLFFCAANLNFYNNLGVACGILPSHDWGPGFKPPKF